MKGIDEVQRQTVVDMAGVITDLNTIVAEQAGELATRDRRIAELEEKLEAREELGSCKS